MINNIEDKIMNINDVIKSPTKNIMILEEGMKSSLNIGRDTILENDDQMKFEQGQKDVAAGKLFSRGSFAKYVNDDLDD